MNMADMTLTFDPVPPWSYRPFGLIALAVVAGVIGVATVWTYWIGSRGNLRRCATMLALRLTALAVACLLLWRPAIARFERIVAASKLLLLIDQSRSMSIEDGFNNQSRWEDALRILQAPSVRDAFERLQRRRVQVVWYQAAEEVKEFDSSSLPTGKRTEMGWWLQALLRRHSRDENLRGVILLSDGADNGTRAVAIEQAANWRGLGVPVFALGLGNTNTQLKQMDIYFEPNTIRITPSPAYVKGRFSVRTVVHAPGFAETPVTARLFVDGKEKTSKQVLFPNSRNNTLNIACDAPEVPGDYRVTVRIDPLANEVNKENNAIETYLRVTKEGISVLWVEGQKRLESSWIIRNALKTDKRIRVYYTERLRQAGGGSGPDDPYELGKRHYDVVVIGDISGSRFCAGNPKLFATLRKMVEKKGTGLLMLGGYETFGNSDWDSFPDFMALMPVTWPSPEYRGQIEGPVWVEPTDAGYAHYVLRLADDPERNRLLFQDPAYFRPLQGATIIGKLIPTATVLATSRSDGKPLMAFRFAGAGRVLVFGGDTTHVAWCRNPDSLRAFQRFWNRLIRWLARQEESSGSIWVNLDTRRIPTGMRQRLGITVGLRDEKPERASKPLTYTVTVTDPKNVETAITTFPIEEDMRAPNNVSRLQRGFYWSPPHAGEYQVKVSAKYDDGTSAGDPVVARFLAYDEDLESLQPAANHEHLAAVARAAGGTFRIAGEHDLSEILDQIIEQTRNEERLRGETWPQWDARPQDDSLGAQVTALWRSGALVCYLAFATLVCLEWYLRRRWGMV